MQRSLNLQIVKLINIRSACGFKRFAKDFGKRILTTPDIDIPEIGKKLVRDTRYKD